MSQSTKLVRVPAKEVRAGDRMGDGRWQGVQIVATKVWPTLDGTYHISLGNHGWLSFYPKSTVLVERRLTEGEK